MKLSQNNVSLSCAESDIYNSVLQLDNRDILELGCGKADITRAIANDGENRHITALEVDKRQHAQNLKITDLANVSFRFGGAEDIPVADKSQDIVCMFKSLHHVPEDKLTQAMNEIRRVLRPQGMVYISEPVFSGAFNDILRLFHDEQHVRQAAFSAIEKSVTDRLFILKDEIFFNTTVKFRNFSDFENQVMNVTHTSHQLGADVFEEVKARFQEHCGASGAEFTTPMRVDLLQG